MIGDGPFRDTAPAMIAHARDQLAQLRAQRADAQAQFEDARAAVDKLLAVSSGWQRCWRGFKTGVALGAAAAVLSWVSPCGGPPSSPRY